MTMRFYFVILALISAARAAENMPFIRMRDLQGVANPEQAQWLSMSRDVEFLPVDDLPNKRSIRRKRALQEDEDGDQEEENDQDADGVGTGKWEDYNPYSVQPFVEGVGDYDEYQQAWRLLGFMIDCNSVPADYDNQSGSQSQDEDATDQGCARYILWAAVSHTVRFIFQRICWYQSLMFVAVISPFEVRRFGI